MADDAGALLVRSGLVSASALDDARSRVVSQGGTIGEQLVAAGVITDDALTDFYRKRLLVPQVNPNTLARLSPKVIATIPSDMAIELRAIPVSLDAENNLTVAMSDPSDRQAVDEIAFHTSAYVVRAVATQMQIAWCLAHYYGHLTTLGARLVQPARAGGQAPARAPTPEPRALRSKSNTGQIQAARPSAAAAGGGASGEGSLSGALDLFGLATAPGKPPEAAKPAPEAAPAPPDEPRQRASSPEISVIADGVPDQPRARSVSGEVRVPLRVRAASIKPLIPDPHGGDEEDDDEPVISISHGAERPAARAATADEDDDDEPVISVSESTEASGPRMLPVRRRVKTDPPELAARAGEVSLAARPERNVDDQPAIIIAEDQLVQPDYAPPPVAGELRAITQPDEEAAPIVTIEVDTSSPGIVIHDYAVPESEPVLLERRRTPNAPAAPMVARRAPSNDDGMDTTDEEVVVLEARKKPAAPRPEKRTQVGIGASPAVIRSRGAEPAAVPESLDDAPTKAQRLPVPDGPTNVDLRAAPALPDDTDETLAAPPAPSRGNDDDDDDDDDVAPRGPTTAVMSNAELDAVMPGHTREVVPAHLARRIALDDAGDDGWGPPGTTIPPPLLGALPGVDEEGDLEDGGRIPMSNVNTAPLIVAPPAPPEPARGAPAASEAAGIVRVLEDSTSRAIQLIHKLERATDRDAVISLMIGHLGETHMRAGFFAIRPSAEGGKAGELAVWRIDPGPPTLPVDSLRLDRPSTLQDVVGTRLPYRGPMHDDASRMFLANVLGACPPEILLVPVTVRDRVVGVLFGEHRMRHTFDDQLALAARAAGMALERILLTKRG